MSFDEIMMKLLDWNANKAEREALRLIHSGRSVDNALLDVIQSMSLKSTARMRRWIQNPIGYYEWQKAYRWGAWSTKRVGKEVVLSRMKTGNVMPEPPSDEAIAASVDA